MDAMVEEMVKLRKGKMSEEQVRDALTHRQLFWNHAGKNGKGRLPFRWSNIFYGRYGAPGITVN